MMEKMDVRSIVKLGVISNDDFLKTVKEVTSLIADGDQSQQLPELTTNEHDRVANGLPVVIEEFRNDAINVPKLNEDEIKLLLITGKIEDDRYYGVFNEAIEFLHFTMKDGYGDPSSGEYIEPVTLVVSSSDLAAYFDYNEKLPIEKKKVSMGGTLFVMLDYAFEDFRTKCNWLVKIEY